MISLTPIAEKIQKRMFEKMDILGRENTGVPGKPKSKDVEDGLTLAKMSTRSTFIRMTSGQKNPVILMGGELMETADEDFNIQKNMAQGYDTIYGSRTYISPNLEDNFEILGQNKNKRPMPGIKSIDASFKGGVRALREATISWTCWSWEELNRLMPHFLAHGKTVLVQWGWVYDEKTLEKLPSFLTEDDFENKFISADAYSHYQDEIEKSDGDFDMMVGVIKNFEFTTRDDGGFDCQTIITSVGASILDTVQSSDTNVFDPGITYNIEFKENTKDIETKIKKATGETRPGKSQAGGANDLIDLNTSVTLKYFIRKIDDYITGRLQKTTDISIEYDYSEDIEKSENIFSLQTVLNIIEELTPLWFMQQYGAAELKAASHKFMQITAWTVTRKAMELANKKMPPPQLSNTWVTWGWFEDNILSKFLSLTSSDSNVNQPITEFRSVEDIKIGDKYYVVPTKIKNHPELETININDFILPGQFYPQKPQEFLLPVLDENGNPTGESKSEKLLGDEGYLQDLAKIVNTAACFFPFAANYNYTNNDYYTDKKEGYLRNMLINTKLIKQAFGVTEDSVNVEPINIIESIETLLSLINSKLNFWDFEIVSDNNRSKIIDTQITAFDFNELVDGGETVASKKSTKENLNGIFYFPTWKHNSFVKKQNITAKIPNAMQLAAMYGSNMNQLKDLVNPGSQFINKTGVAVGGLFNDIENTDKRFENMDIAFKNKNYGRKIGNKHPQYYGGETDRSDWGQSATSIGKLKLDIDEEDIEQFLKDNASGLEKPYEQRLLKIKESIKQSKLAKEYEKMTTFDSALPIPMSDDLGDKFIDVLKYALNNQNTEEGKERAKSILLTYSSKFFETGEMKMQFIKAVNYLTTQHGVSKNANTPLLIPLELELEIDGIGGIQPFNSFHSTYTPKTYQDNTVFQAFDINHRVDSSGWSVVIRGKMRTNMSMVLGKTLKVNELKEKLFDNFINKEMAEFKKSTGQERVFNKLIDAMEGIHGKTYSLKWKENLKKNRVDPNFEPSNDVKEALEVLDMIDYNEYKNIATELYSTMDALGTDINKFYYIVETLSPDQRAKVERAYNAEFGIPNGTSLYADILGEWKLKSNFKNGGKYPGFTFYKG